MRSMVSATSGRGSPGWTLVGSTRGLMPGPRGVARCPATAGLPGPCTPARAPRGGACPPRQKGCPDRAHRLAVLGGDLGLEGEQLVAALGLGGGDLARGQQPVAGPDRPVGDELLLAGGSGGA